MDNNDSIKPQQTGGLKIMTVFVVVLALHVVAIGGITVYYLMNGGNADTDLATLDKTHKDLKGDGASVADGTQPDVSQGEKSAPTPTPTPEVASIPANPPKPAPAAASAPAPEPVQATPGPTASSPAPEIVDEGTETPSGPIPSKLAPSPESISTPSEPVTTPSAPLAAAGPVHMPAIVTSAPTREHAHEQIYVVKITDSYKKIAHAHHVTVAQLKEANHIKGDVLHTGQRLVIPSTKTFVVTTESASATALDASPSGPILSESAPTAILASTSSMAATPTSHHHLYTVVKGDTLIKIARKFKTTASAIMEANSITDPGKLAIGKKLRIPSRESRSARNNVPASTPPSQVEAKPDAPSAQLANFVP